MDSSSAGAHARHAVVAGSLGKGNAGDDAILEAFLNQHVRDYASVIVLTHDGKMGKQEGS